MSKEASRKTLSYRSTVERQPNVSHFKIKKLRTRTVLLTCLAPINLTLRYLRDLAVYPIKTYFENYIGAYEADLFFKTVPNNRVGLSRGDLGCPYLGL